MIAVDNLSLAYGDKQALKGVSFKIEPGQICGYLGPNGAGKSTTVKILTGMLQPTSGRALVAGHDVSQQPLEAKRRIGYVPETGAVFSTLSPNEYLALVGALHELEPAVIAERTRTSLELFQIPDLADRRLDTFSKGQRQKVVIAAALLPDPDIVLFDEPLSGLDANAARIIKDLLVGLAERGKTILFCSHMLEVVERLCSRVLILHEGQLVADGPPAQLMAQAKRGTLEEVFRSLTGNEDSQALAAAFLDAHTHAAKKGPR
jgi:ABC-2 type transport system ATP-binding protein